MGSSIILPSPGQPKTGPDPNFRTPSIPNIVTFGFDQIDPPAGLYIQRDDQLVLDGVTIISPENLNILGRVLLPYAQAGGQPDAPPHTGPAGGPVVGPGYIQTFKQTLALPVALTSASQVLTGLEGYLLSLSVTCTAAFQRGTTFARAWINRGSVLTTTPNAFGTLISDYITTTSPLGWPWGRYVSPVEGPGFLNIYTPGNPAAGTDLSFTSNLAGRVRLATFSATLTTSAAAGNRFVSFRLIRLPSTNIEYRVQDTAAVVASSVVVYSLAPGATNVRGGGAIATEQDITLPLPAPYTATTGLRVNSVTQGLLAGDQWSAVTVGTEEWIEQL